MKKLLSSLLITSFIVSTTYSPKSEAGVLLALSGMGISSDGARGGSQVLRNIGTGVMMAGGVALVAGLVSVAIVPLAGVFLIVLSEDGSVSQPALESRLSEQFPFISDREVIAEFASDIRARAKSQKPDQDGKILVSFTKEEVVKILSPLDLEQNEIDQVVSALK